MTTKEYTLLEMLRRRCTIRKSCQLASGNLSDIYLDIRRASVSPMAALIGEVIADRLAGTEFDAIGGPASGAIPLVTAAVLAFKGMDRAVDGFWTLANEKDHGLGGKVFGDVPPNARVVIVDDVMSGGQSIMSSVTAAREKGWKVVDVVPLVDRLHGGREFLAAHGVGCNPIYTIHSFKRLD